MAANTYTLAFRGTSELYTDFTPLMLREKSIYPKPGVNTI